MNRFGWVGTDLKDWISKEHKSAFMASNAYLVVVFDNQLMPTIQDAVAEEGVGIYDKERKFYPAGITYDGNLYYEILEGDMVPVTDNVVVPRQVLEDFGRAFIEIHKKSISDPYDTAFEDQVQKVVNEMRELIEVWDENKVKNYPKYLPSFDEFVAEFAGMLED